MEVNHEYVRTNGVTLHVAQAGPEDGPLVVLLHGFPEFWYGWREQISALAEAGFQVWAPDQRGYNLSEKPPGVGSYVLDSLAADVIGLLDAAGTETAYVAGHDWGAAVAWWLGINHPDRLEKIAILNVPHPAVLVPFIRSHPSQLLKSWYMLFFQLPHFPELLLEKAGPSTLLNSSEPGVFDKADLERYQQAWNRPGALKAMVNWYRAAARQGGYRQVPAPTVYVPTLMIWGEDDAVLDKRMADASVELCEDGRLVKLPGITHWVQHEAAGEVNRLLIDHFQVAGSSGNLFSQTSRDDG